jgi:serine protease Do
MKRIAYLLAFLLLPVSYFAQGLPQLYKEVSSSVVYIRIVNVSQGLTAQGVELMANEASGSGVLVSDDGLIWTAAHVVQSAELVKVEFQDGQSYEADVLSSFQIADVALLKIKGDFDTKGRHVAKIGDSDQVPIGEELYVLGAPHGFKQSLSRGILSGRYYPENLSNAFVKIEFLQTDAAINPGNSGGPVFNTKGEVVGIASRIYTNSGGFEGIGFAVSSKVAKELLSSKNAIWGGMDTQLLSPEMAAILNVPQEGGLLVMNVSTKGAGSQLNLRGGFIPVNIAGSEIMLGGDIILEIGGITIKDINSIFRIRQLIANAPAGQKISITILREGKIGAAEFSKQ